MPRCRRVGLIGLAAMAASLDGGTAPAPPRGAYPLSPVPFTRVRLADTFWAPRVETNRTRHHPLRLPEERGGGPHPELRAGGESPRRGLRRQDAVRRHRRLQADRRRVLLAPDPSRPGARALHWTGSSPRSRPPRSRTGTSRPTRPSTPRRARPPGSSPVPSGSSSCRAATSSTTRAISTRRPTPTIAPPASAISWTSR